jgi:mRNA interferase MazF
MQRGNVKRGEIYLHDFGNNEGSIQNGVRPVLVIQCDDGNQASTTTIVAALTSVIKKRYMPSHIILGDKFGLKEPSMVMLEQLKTVNQSELTEYIGFVDSEHLLRKINHGLKKVVGLWVDKPQKHKGDIRCLCPACLKAYKAAPDYIVRRLDPLASKRDKCDKCDSMGWDYIIYKGCSSTVKEEVQD